MTTLKRLALAAGLAVAALGTSPVALAQTTDAIHTIQVFPVVVDTASFAQRFTFRNPNDAAVSIAMIYYPAIGTTQTVALTCGTYVVNAGEDRSFASLRSMCPNLPAGSQFGFLYTYEINPENLPYAGFSRVANPQGNGFSVEAFAANEFTSADAVVAGIRRQAATPSSPAFQTNCFVGNLNDFTPPVTPVTTTVTVTLFTNTGTQIGTPTNFNLLPGQITRLLDVFAAVGAAAGDYIDARAQFVESGAGEPGILAFCTVQDNTSFGADFRIAKQEFPGGGEVNAFIGPQDDYVARETNESSDVTTSGPTSRVFEVGLASHANTHVIYFHHPDWIQCELIDPTTGVRVVPAYGLEMRMLDNTGAVIAGGNESYGWGEFYLGDKTERNTGANGRYTIEVESTAANQTSTRPYQLHCQSGSGHTMGEIIRYQDATDRF